MYRGQRGEGAVGGCPFPRHAKRGSCGFFEFNGGRHYNIAQLGDSLLGSKQLVVVGATSDELNSETESKVAEGSLTASLSLQRLAGGSPSSQVINRSSAR